MENIQVTFKGMESSDALREYALEKLTKRQSLLEGLIKGDVSVSQSVHAKGVSSDFHITINFAMPKATIRVEESDADMYAAIDKASDILFRRVKRYHDKRQQWDGNTPWRVLEAENAVDTVTVDEDLDDYADYTPNIARRTVLDNNSPMSEGEAIEHLEMSGRSQILFRHAELDRHCMIYRQQDGTYAMEYYK